jgi:hypothetical protein
LQGFLPSGHFPSHAAASQLFTGQKNPDHFDVLRDRKR